RGIERAAHRGHLERLSHALRRGRRVSVRQLRRRRCHVRADGLALPHLCRRGRPCGARLYGRGDGAASVGRMARGGAHGTLGAAGRRGGLANGYASLTAGAVRLRHCDKKMPRKCIDSCAGTKEKHAHPAAPLRRRREGGTQQRDYLPYRLELSSCDIVVSLCFRRWFRSSPPSALQQWRKKPRATSKGCSI